MSAKRILFYFQPNLNRFWTRSGAMHDESAEWTSSWHGLCSKMWNPPQMEVQTLWVSTWKKDISFGNKFDWWRGSHMICLSCMCVWETCHPYDSCEWHVSHTHIHDRQSCVTHTGNWFTTYTNAHPHTCTHTRTHTHTHTHTHAHVYIHIHDWFTT